MILCAASPRCAALLWEMATEECVLFLKGVAHCRCVASPTPWCCSRSFARHFGLWAGRCALFVLACWRSIQLASFRGDALHVHHQCERANKKGWSSLWRALPTPSASIALQGKLGIFHGHVRSDRENQVFCDEACDEGLFP